MGKIGSKIDEVRVDGNLTALKRDLDHYAKIGLQATEIPVHGLDLIRNGVLDRRRLREVLEILRDFDFEYSVHSPNPLNLMDERASNLHHRVFAASLDFTCSIGAKILVYHAGRFIPEERFLFPRSSDLSERDALRLLEMERDLLAKLGEAYPGIALCVENARPYLYHSPYCYGEQIDLLKQQVEAVNLPNVKINLDVGHLYMAACHYRFDPVEAVKGIKDLIAHTHVHDNFGGAIYHNEKTQTHLIPFGRGDAHMPVGWGEIPVGEILSAFVDSYDGLFMMELRSRYFGSTEESRENLQQILNGIR